MPELKEQYPEFYDTAVVTIQLDNGAFGMLDGVCPVDYGYDARAEVVGTEGVLLIGEMHRTAVTRVTRSHGLVEDHHVAWRDRFAQAYIGEARHFVDTLQGRAQPVAGSLDGRRALEGVLAANLSIRTGLPVSFPLTS